MFFYLLFFYLLSESMATNCTNDSTTDTNNMTKPIILCDYIGNITKFYRGYDDIDPKDLPYECDFIVFRRFSINQSSMIYVNQEILNELIALNKSIILSLNRDESYTGWTPILGPNGNKCDAKVLCDFAKNNSIKGYTIENIVSDGNEVFDKNIGKYIIPYLKQLKELCPSNFIIGLGVSVVPEILNNIGVYNFEKLNDIVTFYELYTNGLNTCNPKLYNGVTPITLSVPGPDYLYGLEEVVSNLKKTKICFKKLIFIIPMSIYYPNYGRNPYTLMCSGIVEFDNSSMCVQTSQNFFNKGKFLHDLSAGMEIGDMDFDDYGGTCQCLTKFNGFYNLYAGYRNGTVKPCPKFDVQSTVYPIK